MRSLTKLFICLLLSAFLLISVILTGCNSDGNTPEGNTDDAGTQSQDTEKTTPDSDTETQSVESEISDTAESETDIFKYTLLSDGTYAVSARDGAAVESVTVPAEAPDGKRVSMISDGGFKAFTGLKSVIISDGITRIGQFAFSECTSLATVTLPATLERIDYNAFAGSGIVSISIPAGVTSVGGFADCASLASVEIAEGVEEIRTGAFKNCTALKAVVLPNSVTSSAFGAFKGCTGIESISASCTAIDNLASCFDWTASGMTADAVPSSLKSVVITEGNEIYGEMFAGCSSIESVTVPETVTKIGEYAFYGCSSLAEITVPDGVVSIGKYAFYNCDGLTSVIIPDGVLELGDSAFSGCSNLQNATVGNGVTCAEDNLFLNCTSLKSVSFGNGITYFSPTVLKGCDSLISLTVPHIGANRNDDRATHLGFIFGSEFDNSCVPATLRSVTVTCGTIESDAFKNCESISAVILGEDVKYIEFNAFYGCRSLESITLSKSIESIDMAFVGCEALTNINYRGTQEEWESIQKDNAWDYGTGEYTVTYNYNG